MLVVTEAYMPKAVDYYRVNVSSLLNARDQIFPREVSDVHEGVSRLSSEYFSEFELPRNDPVGL